MQYELFPSDRFSFFSLSSGSCGNCYYLGNSHYGLLIDAGIGPRIMKKRLAEYGIDFSMIYAVLVTHDHYDHIKGIGYLAGKLDIPIYATDKVHQAMSRSPFLSGKLTGARKSVKKKEPFQIDDFRITAFEVPHDSADNIGYFIEFKNQTFTLVTDVGIITDEIAYYICKANHLVIESNYDEKMLQDGNYPFHLKQRITCGTGHLSNQQTADFIANSYSSNLRNIFLCHLSGDNNHPDLAYETVQRKLSQRNIKVGSHVALHVLKRNVLSPKIDF